MSDSCYRARLDVRACSVGFETDHFEAFEYLMKLESFFSIADYRFVQDERVLPCLRYQNGDHREIRYCVSEDTLFFVAPWSEVPGSTMLRMAIMQLCELSRQRRGEYLFHAGAVVWNERAVILYGPSGAGKTTVTLDLCLNHGCELSANDEVKIGLKGDRPMLLGGDAVFNLRYSSIYRYDPDLTDRFFASPSGSRDLWNTKKLILPEEFGIPTASAPAPIEVFAFLRLDNTLREATLELLDYESFAVSTFEAKVELYSSMASLVRGARFVPFDRTGRISYWDIPDLDRPELSQKRIEFIEKLYAYAAVVKIHGPLPSIVTELNRLAAGCRSVG